MGKGFQREGERGAGRGWNVTPPPPPSLPFTPGFPGIGMRFFLTCNAPKELVESSKNEPKWAMVSRIHFWHKKGVKTLRIVGVSENFQEKAPFKFQNSKKKVFRNPARKSAKRGFFPGGVTRSHGQAAVRNRG